MGKAVISDEEDEVELDEDDERDPNTVELDTGAGGEDEEVDEGPDEYEKDEFVIHDVDEEEQEEQDMADSHEERQKKREEYAVDENDYELLEDKNVIAIRIKGKFKRLKKAQRHAQGGLGELSDEEEYHSAGKGRRTAEEKLKRTLFGDDEGLPLEDIDEEEESAEADDGGEDEMAEFIVDREFDDETGIVRQRKLKKKKSRKGPGVSSSAVQEAHDIFGDGDECLQIHKQGLQSSEWKERRREDEFEPIVLLERYTTPRDDQIQEIDEPERMQTKWPEQSKELIGLMVNTSRALDGAVPQGCPDLSHRSLSVQENSIVLDKAPNLLQPDLVSLVPKLVENSEQVEVMEEFQNPNTEPASLILDDPHGTTCCYVIFDGGIVVGVDSLKSETRQVNENYQYVKEGNTVQILLEEDERKFQEVIAGVGITAVGNANRNKLLWDYLEGIKDELHDVNSVCRGVKKFIKDKPLAGEPLLHKYIMVYVCGYCEEDKKFVVHRIGDEDESGKIGGKHKPGKLKEAYGATKTAANDRLEKKLKACSVITLDAAVSAVRYTLMNAVIDDVSTGGFLKVYMLRRGSCQELFKEHAIDMALEMRLSFNSAKELFFFDQVDYEKWNYHYLSDNLLTKHKLVVKYSCFGHVRASWKFLKVLIANEAAANEVWDAGREIPNDDGIKIRERYYLGLRCQHVRVFMAQGNRETLRRVRHTDLLDRLVVTSDELRSGAKRAKMTKR